MHKNGTEFPVELTITRIGLPGPPTFTGYLRDITQRKRAEVELRASRARLVEIADAERRRIQRNLHDGAQQRLSAVLLSLGLLRESLEQRSALLDVAIDELAVGLQEIRELASGLHPSVLADRGLVAALEALALRAPVPVELEAVPDRRLGEQVEAAAYYVVAEALANVHKHAAARRVVVRATTDETSDDHRRVVEVFADGEPSRRFHIAQIGPPEAAETADGGCTLTLQGGATLWFAREEAPACARLLAAIGRHERPSGGETWGEPATASLSSTPSTSLMTDADAFACRTLVPAWCTQPRLGNRLISLSGGALDFRT
jgi:hypothetical protein